MVVAHGSHFVYFLLFCLGVWCYAPAEFPRCRRAMMTMMVLGLLGYLLVPTVPPHIAAASFGAIAPIHWLRGEIYQQAMPHVQYWFDTNPIAAMPSLHAAFPSLCALIAAHHLRWRAWPFFAYGLCMLFSIMYLGEHYVVDVLAGMALAFFCFSLFYPIGNRFASDRIQALRKMWGEAPPSRSLVRPALLALSLFVVAEGGEKLANEWYTDLWMHESFVERELADLPAAPDLFLAHAAYRRRDHRLAVHHYERALIHVGASHRSRVRQALARSAAELSDHAGVNAARSAQAKRAGS
jgi:membrane-associated phospholipid phosphatase